MSLALTLESGSLPPPSEWSSLASALKSTAALIRSDEVLSSVWIRTWERESGVDLEDAFGQVTSECTEQVEACMKLVENTDIPKTYARIVEQLDLLTPANRGSGVSTAIAALALAWLAREEPAEGILVAANVLGSDTDTIATMAGALLGAVAVGRPPQLPMDADYIAKETARLAAIADGGPAETFDYPDVLKWHPPRVQLDVVGTIGKDLAVAGLALAEAIGKEIRVTGTSDSAWQWLRLKFGQTVLAKRRLELSPLPSEATPRMEPVPTIQAAESSAPTSDEQEPLFASRAAGRQPSASRRQVTVDEAIKQVVTSKFSPVAIGTLLLELAKRPDGTEAVIAFSSAIVQLRRAER
jgi:hypothetical protein